MRSKETETFGFYLSDEVKSGRMWGHFEAQIGLWKKASSKTASRKEAQLWYFTFSLVNFHFFCQHPVKNWHFLWTPSQNQLNVPIKCQKVIDIVKLVSSSVSSTHPTDLILMEVSKYIARKHSHLFLKIGSTIVFPKKDTESIIPIQPSLLLFFPKKYTGSCIPSESFIVSPILVYRVLYAIRVFYSIV